MHFLSIGDLKLSVLIWLGQDANRKGIECAMFMLISNILLVQYLDRTRNLISSLITFKICRGKSSKRGLNVKTTDIFYNILEI